MSGLLLLAVTTFNSQAATLVTRGTGLVGDGVSLRVQQNDGFFGDGELSGGQVHSPGGPPDLWFRAGSTPSFPGTLTTSVSWNSGGFPYEGAIVGADNWMKVIRDGDGAVSWAQFEFESFLGFPNGPTLIDIPLYVTRTDGADFSLAEAVAAVSDTDGDGVPNDEDLFPDDPKRATIVDHINCIIEYVSDDEVIFDSDWKTKRMRVAYINKLEAVLERCACSRGSRSC